ncbi:MAG TPA: DUF2512 family protein [Bacillales bacterium]
MTSFILKIIACPLILIFAMYMLDNVDYGSIWQPIVVGVVLALVGVAMEYMILKEGSLWISTIADFVVSVIIIWVLSNVFDGANVTFWGAVITSIIIGVMEYFVHRYLIASGKTKKVTA